MTAPVPSRAAIERAGDLDFTRPRKEMVLTIHAVVDGFSVDLNFTGSIEQLPAAIKRLRELGAEPQEGMTPRRQSSDAPRKPATRTQPAYDGDGQPMCPVHKRALKDGKWGPYCSARDQETGEYCKLKFE